MLIDFFTKGSPQPRDLPPEFYASQVDALFSDVRSFIVGAIAACASAVTVAIETGALVSWVIAILLGVLSGLRLWAMRAYSRQQPDAATMDAVRRWEVWYIAGASTHIGLLGMFCLVTFEITTDPFARLLSFAITLAYLIGTPGRNFASAFGVNIQVLCAAVPLLTTMAVAGSAYWLVSVLVLVPLFIALKAISARLRGIFVQAVTKAHELSLLVGRFDTALDNMPHGLAMFDAEGRIVVHNRRLIDLLMLEPGVDYRGVSVATLLAHCEHGEHAAQFQARQIQAHLRSPSLDVLGLEVRDGRSLALSFQAMSNGGAVALAQDITESKRAEARIRQLAHFDPLTNLPNRTHFHTLLETVLAPQPGRSQRHALMFVDLDQFKQVNDTLGHARGDMLLCEVAERLRLAIGPNDAVARFGGDEFVILRRAGQGRREAELLAKNVIEQLSRPYHIDGNTVVIGASIGIALIPEHGTDPDQLLKEADTALYRSKAEGRGSWRFFEASMDTEARARRDLEFDLRQALRRGEFELHFQPIFNLRQRRFTVCEALLRWNHPERGKVSPGEFVPVAEEMGLIVEIGDWVLRQACAECMKWPSGINVAVNISPLQFRRGGIVASVRKALTETGLPAQRLEVELTESVLLQDLPFTGGAMQQLHDMKVGISLDDFGTGYSSLSYLHSLPLNKVKIDRAFLEGLGTSEKTLVILRGVARLSAELGLSVVVEGIETEEQLAVVAAESNIGEVQGFYFSRPLPVADLRSLLLDSAAQAA